MSDGEARKARWRAFMARESQVPYMFMVRFWPDDFWRPAHAIDLIKERKEWAWSNYCRQLEQTTWLEDDTLPYLDCLTGVEIFAEAFGAEIFRPKNDQPYAYPIISDASQVASVKVPRLDAPSLARMFEFADDLFARSGRSALVRTVDVQSPMDIAAILWDKNDYYAALIEAPEAVQELASKIRELLIAFLDEWFARYGRQHIAHYPDYFMDGGLTLSEDEIGAVSPEIFEELFLPELNALSDHFGGIGIHCCANSRHQWPGFKKVRNLRLLNLGQPKEVLQEAFPFFADHVVQWHSWNGDGDPWTWREQLPTNARYVIDTWATTRDDALRIAEKLRTN